MNEIDKLLNEVLAVDFEQLIGKRILFELTYECLPAWTYCARVQSVSPNGRYVELKPLDIQDDTPYFKSISIIRLLDVLDR